MDDAADKLIIDASRIDPEGETIEGEVFAVDICEEFVKPFGGVRYRLHLQVLGTELLVRGQLEQDFELVCSRCGKDFDDTVKTDDFTMSYEIGGASSEIDLTEDVRESVLLELSSHPLCSEACPGIEQKHIGMPKDSRWDTLDGLALK